MTRFAPLALTVGLLAVAPIHSQSTWTGTRLPGGKPGNVVAVGTADAIKVSSAQQKSALGTQVAMGVATCVATHAAVPAGQAALAVDAAAQGRAMRAMMPVLQSCMANGEAEGTGSKSLNAREMRLKTSVLDGLLAQSLLRRERAVALVQPQPAIADYKVPWASESADAAIVDEMAVCVASREPALAQAVIWSDPETAGEGAAFTALSPALGSCLRANATLKANRLGIRAALARAYLFRVKQPGATSQVAK